MESKLEVEYKMLLTKKQFEQLCNKYPEQRIIKQHNFYYDSTPSLKERGMGCRIRQIENQYIFTLKIKEKLGHQEIEFKVSANDIHLPEIKKVLHQFQITDLKERGDLLTYRHFIDLRSADLCIDENHYSGTIDYEVEYELKDAKHDTFDEFMQILNSLDIEYIPNKRSKIQRCMEMRNKE